MKRIAMIALALTLSPYCALAGGTNPTQMGAYGTNQNPAFRAAKASCASELAKYCTKAVGEGYKLDCLKNNSSKNSAACNASL